MVTGNGGKQQRTDASLITAAMLTVCTACGAPPLLELGDLEHRRNQPIIGGQASASSDFPTVGVILVIGVVGEYGMGSMLCTGTLIAPDVVLTAGHCTENPLVGYTNEYYLYFSFSADVTSFGESTLELPPRTWPVRAALPHPEWNMSALNYFTGGLADFKDIALLMLDGQVEDVAPAMLMEEDDASNLTEGAEVDIAGYGQVDADDPYSTGVKFHASSHINEVGTTEMQIGDVPTSSPQKCHGDSGGPTFQEFNDGKDPLVRLVGVTSHAYDETDCHKGGVDTRVDPYLAWIKQALTTACSDGLRTACAEGGALAVPSELVDPDPDPVDPDPDPTDPDPTDPDPTEPDPTDPDPTDPDPTAPNTDPAHSSDLPDYSFPPERARFGVGNSCAALALTPTPGAIALLCLVGFGLRRRHHR